MELFRGKDKNTNQWIYGWLVSAIDPLNGNKYYIVEKPYIKYSNDGTNIIIDNFIEVIPTTIGKSFNYQDDCGKTIYDKDIIEFQHETYNVPTSDGKWEKRCGDVERYLVEWVDECQEFVILSLKKGNSIMGTAEVSFYNLSTDNLPLSTFIPMLLDLYGNFRNEYGGHIRSIGNAYDNPSLISSIASTQGEF